MTKPTQARGSYTSQSKYEHPLVYSLLQTNDHLSVGLVRISSSVLLYFLVSPNYSVPFYPPPSRDAVLQTITFTVDRGKDRPILPPNEPADWPGSF